MVFCTEIFKNFCDENLMVWAGNIWNPEAYDLSLKFKTSAYPFLVLLVCRSERTVEVVDRIQGLMGVAAVIERLQNGISAYQTVINRVRNQNIQR